MFLIGFECKTKDRPYNFLDKNMNFQEILHTIAPKLVLFKNYNF